MRRYGGRCEEDADRSRPRPGQSARAGRSHENDLTWSALGLREVEPERGLGDPRGQSGNGERGESEGEQSAHGGHSGCRPDEPLESRPTRTPLNPVQRGRKGVRCTCLSRRARSRAREPGRRVCRKDPSRRRSDPALARAHRARDHRGEPGPRPRRARRHPDARGPARSAPAPVDRGVQRAGGPASARSTSRSTATTCRCAGERLRCTPSPSFATRS